jgi:AcrR family transcriptional regulator
MQKNPKREALSRQRVLAAALAIVDREGLGAISMRRLGDELGVEAMSLYNHVANKADLLDGIFEAVLAELPPPRRTSSWSSALRGGARGLRHVLRAHPAVIPIFTTRPAVTPASLVHVESALLTLRNAGFSVHDALSVFQIVVAYVVGHTAQAYPPGSPEGRSSPAYAELDAKRFPTVREIAAALAHHDLDREFNIGLEALIAGFEVRLAKVLK